MNTVSSALFLEFVKKHTREFIEKRKRPTKGRVYRALVQAEKVRSDSVSSSVLFCMDLRVNCRKGVALLDQLHRNLSAYFQRYPDHTPWLEINIGDLLNENLEAIPNLRRNKFQIRVLLEKTNPEKK